MKKLFACLLKLAAMLAVLSAAAYAVALNWDRIEAAVYRLKDALEGRKCCCGRDEDDYEDWDECC